MPACPPAAVTTLCPPASRTSRRDLSRRGSSSTTRMRSAVGTVYAVADARVPVTTLGTRQPLAEAQAQKRHNLAHMRHRGRVQENRVALRSLQPNTVHLRQIVVLAMDSPDPFRNRELA